MTAIMADLNKKFDSIEYEICSCIERAAFTMIELSHNRANGKRAKVNARTFMDSLEKVHCDITKQIDYLSNESCPRSYEQISYSTQNDIKLYENGLDLISTKLKELNEIRLSHAADNLRLNSIIQSMSPNDLDPSINDLDTIVRKE